MGCSALFPNGKRAILASGIQPVDNTLPARVGGTVVGAFTAAPGQETYTVDIEVEGSLERYFELVSNIDGI